MLHWLLITNETFCFSLIQIWRSSIVLVIGSDIWGEISSASCPTTVIYAIIVKLWRLSQVGSRNEEWGTSLCCPTPAGTELFSNHLHVASHIVNCVSMTASHWGPAGRGVDRQSRLAHVCTNHTKSALSCPTLPCPHRLCQANSNTRVVKEAPLAGLRK